LPKTLSLTLIKSVYNEEIILEDEVGLLQRSSRPKTVMTNDYIYKYFSSFRHEQFGEASLQRSAKETLEEASTLGQQERRIMKYVWIVLG